MELPLEGSGVAKVCGYFDRAIWRSVVILFRQSGLYPAWVLGFVTTLCSSVDDAVAQKKVRIGQSFAANRSLTGTEMLQEALKCDGNALTKQV
jgi:hypothetical protein